MKKKISPKSFYILAGLSLAIAVYQFMTSTIWAGFLSILYALVFTSAGINRKIIIDEELKTPLKLPKYFTASVFSIGLLIGITLTYIFFTELYIYR